MRFFDKPAIVLDIGSRYVKAGFACDNHPVSMFRTVVGRPSYLNGKYGRQNYYDVYIGDDAVEHSAGYDLTSPLSAGRIIHWDNMERLWHHVFYKELRAAPEDRAVLMACMSDTPMAEKYKICQVMFEMLNVPAICLQPQPVLSLYSYGLGTGMSVDIGYDSTNICPVYESGTLTYAQTSTGVSGRQLCSYINECLLSRSIDLGPTISDVVDDMMKQHLYLTNNIAMSRKNFKRMFKLPNGISIDVGQEAFMTPELFFNAEMVLGDETQFVSLPDAVIESGNICCPDIRNELFNDIVLGGGLSMIPCIGQRLASGIEKKMKRPVRVLTSKESYVVPWLGGATFAAMPQAQQAFVTKRQYEEQGTKIIKNKFIF